MKFLDDFKYFNRVKRLNGCLQTLLIILLIFGIHTLLPFGTLRFDFSDSHLNSLHAETKAFLQSLKGTVEIFLLQDAQQLQPEFLHEFKRFMHAVSAEFKAGRSSFEFNRIDTLKNPHMLLQLQKKYDMEDYCGVLISVNGRSVCVPFSHFYKDKTFIGETCLLSTLIKLTAKPKKICWVLGHGEMNPKDMHPVKGGSLAYKEFRRWNMDVQLLDTCNDLPADTNWVVVFGPQLAFLPQECAQLKEFINNRNGNVLVCLHPLYEHGLDEFLGTFGIRCDGELLLDNSKDFLSNDGNLIIRRFNKHVITQPLIDKSLGLVFGLSSVLKLKESECLTPCLLSSETSWIRDSQNLDNLLFNAKTDLTGPYVLGAAYVSYKSDTFNLNLPKSKMVVVACSDWLDNAHFHLLGNQTFLQACCQFFENDNSWLPTVDVHVNQSPKIVITQQKFFLLALNFMLLPFVFFIGGIIAIVLRKE